MTRIVTVFKNIFLHIDPLDDLVFENKNKDYGAYVVRKKHNGNVRRALIITTTITFLICFSDFIYTKYIRNYLEMSDTEISPNIDIVAYLDNIPLNAIVKPPSELQKGKSPQQMETEIPSIIDSNQVEKNKKKTNLIDQASKDTSSTKPGMNGANEKGDTSSYVIPPGIIERYAFFPGGESSRKNFIRQHLQYPQEAAKAKIGGKVIICFTINKMGKVTDVKVIKSVHPLLDAEAIRVIKMMPRWEPAVKHGKAIYQIIKIPISFIPPVN